MYIYRADVWCDDCGRAICERLTEEGKRRQTRPTNIPLTATITQS